MKTANILSGVARGYEFHVIQQLLKQTPGPLIYVMPHQEDANQLVHRLTFCLDKIPILFLPEWDCLPYDRVSPSQDILSERLNTLMTILQWEKGLQDRPSSYVIVTSTQGFMQRISPQSQWVKSFLHLKTGLKKSFEEIITYLSVQGYGRTETVREKGEFSVRGSILDVFPVGEENPLRLDFFGDIIESIRVFDALTQTTILGSKGKPLDKSQGVWIKPSNEICLTPESIRIFRQKYRELFGAQMTPLYESISQGRRYGGMEHWFPLFFDKAETLLDYIPQAQILIDFQADDVVRTRLELIHDYYDNRQIHPVGDSSPPYNPAPPASLYMTLHEWGDLKQRPQTFQITSFSGDDVSISPNSQKQITDFGCRASFPFDPKPTDLNNINPLKRFLKKQSLIGIHKPILVGALSDGSKDRLKNLLQEHGIASIQEQSIWPSYVPGTLSIMTYPLEHGFEAPNFLFITEQDLLGEKMIRPSSKKRQINKMLLETNMLGLGDLVVHQDHGIGRYQGLMTLQVGDASHDCLCLIYEGGDKLFLPVENIEAITRYADEDSSAPLDKLGSVGWQTRKARAKKRIKEIATYLIKIAAERTLHEGIIMTVQRPSYDDFCARFPYAETEDQLRAIKETLEDLESGKPMDRLICGDVGFGKTEVALRAAFVSVSNGKQVALVAPTTLLCRQHFKTFQDRFSHTGFRVEQLSRFTTVAQAQKIREDMAAGKVDIVIATHTLFSERTTFSDLGLVIIDEEQHFGVKQKEKLKQLQSNVHLLTLTATPIPRTLQLALTGVREMSLIATPPVDRLAVRTFVMPYDPLMIREAILREHHRGGQVFFVCPRLNDMEKIETDLKALVPEIKIIAAHGQLASTQLENIMTAFYDRQYDLLLSTNIVESGIDVANANTLIIHRSDLFGLSQLYQLRGRVGRSKAQSYAYLTLSGENPLTDTARRRLEIMQNLDKLGAGFKLASHDMDIRGTGNIVGEEQSGHIREVGVELYQHLLQEAIIMVRAEQEMGIHLEADWTPQINLGISVMIPETYVQDLSLRMNLYRRIAHLYNREEIDAFAAEMIDRFGKLPPEVHNLFDIIEIKRSCRNANIEKVDVGPKGIVISFRNNVFNNPQGLLEYITNPKVAAKLRPDQKIIFVREWGHPSQRPRTTKLICRLLEKLAAEGEVGN